MWDSIQLQVQIVQALAYREQSERVRKSPFGAAGLLVEPLLLVGTFLLLRLLLRAQGSLFMNPVLQLSSGFVLFYLFSRMALGALSGVSNRDRAILGLRRVKPLDLLMARGLVEVQLYGTCLVAVIVAVSIYQWQVAVANPGAAVAIFLLVSLTSLGVGLSALVIGHRLPLVRFIARLMLRRVLFWTSGLFFSVALIPEHIRPWLLWNPLLHGIELIRHAITPTYPIPGISLTYLISWAGVSLGASMLIYGNNEQLLTVDEGASE